MSEQIPESAFKPDEKMEAANSPTADPDKDQRRARPDRRQQEIPVAFDRRSG